VPGYNEELAHLIYGGADFFLMPSLLNPRPGSDDSPALRHHSIVRSTGGLADSVVDFSGICGNGFRFVPSKARDMLDAVQRAAAVYRDKAAWSKLVSNAFSSDFSWSNSAKKYLALYRSMIKM